MDPETGSPIVENNNVVISEPAFTGTGTPRAATPPEEEVEENAEEIDGADPIVADPAAVATPPVVTEPVATPKAPVETMDTERLAELAKASNYNPADTELDILDEFGNLDATKFGDFMRKNNESVFTQAVGAVQARNQAEQIENNAWNAVHEAYPELVENPSLEKAIRGARIQDLINGGKGDLNELAKGIVGPLRDNKIKAVEEVNRTIKKQENLGAAKPTTAQPEKVAPSLMTQLRTAITNGDNQAAQKIRHAILKERIYGKNSNEA